METKLLSCLGETRRAKVGYDLYKWKLAKQSDLCLRDKLPSQSVIYCQLLGVKKAFGALSPSVW